jgi:hypothetical protein
MQNLIPIFACSKVIKFRMVFSKKQNFFTSGFAPRSVRADSLPSRRAPDIFCRGVEVGRKTPVEREDCHCLPDGHGRLTCILIKKPAFQNRSFYVFSIDKASGFIRTDKQIRSGITNNDFVSIIKPFFTLYNKNP